MENPLELPRPDSLIDRIHAFARDLAFGAVNGDWPLVLSVFRDSYYAPLVNPETDNQQRFSEKWKGYETSTPDTLEYGSEAPPFFMLEMYGYLKAVETEGATQRYTLTPKAFDLLDKPITPPSVFISYRRDESSAFALLVEARLRIAGVPNPFVDKSIAAGETWRQVLVDGVRSSRYFICLVGPTTLDSEYMRQEIAWAEMAGCQIISLWHGGAKMTDDTPEALKSRQAIRVTGESAKEYEAAVNELLNSLGYRTY